MQLDEKGCRLVLGFDAGCATCSELARRIEERVGDKVEVRSLNDPYMQHWRKAAFREGAPWAPTLVEIDGQKVRAWSGLRMGIRLSRALGPLATWRIMQVLGEDKEDLDLGDSAAAKAVSRLTRKQFLKGLGGALVAMSVLSGTGKLPSPAKAASSLGYEEVSGDALVSLARRLAGRKDLLNVMGTGWRDRLRRGSVIEAAGDGVDIEAIDLGDELTFSGGVAVLKAARHDLPDGNAVTAISYAMPRGSRFVVYYEYERPIFLPGDQAKTKTEALLFEQKGEEFVLEKASSNRHSQVLLREETSSEVASSRAWCLPDRRCSSPCDIAYGYSRCHRLKSIGCVAYQCRACAITCAGGPLLCAACALVICTVGVIRECCRGGYGCKRCGWCH